jgi:Tfp pilus assembly protein PilF/TolB-like protein
LGYAKSFAIPAARQARRPVLLALLLASAGCSRIAPSSAKPEPQRFAILRFENLSASSAADWVGRALEEVLSTELSGAPGLSVISTGELHAFDRNLGARPISAPGISAERADALAAGANRLGYGEYSVRAGRLYTHLSVEDARTGRMAKAITISTAANDILGAATEFARQFATRITPYPTRNLECLKAYVEAIESHNASDTAASLDRAIAADPDFGPPYRMLAQLDAQRGDRAGAIAELDRARARGDAIAPIERARIAVEAAALSGDSASRMQALAALAKLEPANPRTWQTLAEAAMSRHDYRQAEDAYRRALEREPESANLLNELGYSATYAGDFDAGLAALRRYRQLRPNDANVLDSLGDLNLLTGHLREAEDLYLQANKRDPIVLPGGPDGDLFKAAMARLMTGDIAGADALEKQFTDARSAAHDSSVPFRELQWLWLTGRRTEAYRKLEALALALEHALQHTGQLTGQPAGQPVGQPTSRPAAQPTVQPADQHTRQAADQPAGQPPGQLAGQPAGQPAASHAYAELAVWSLMRGDRAAAAEMAQKAASLATAATGAPATISRFLAQPSAPAEEWSARADRFLPNSAQDMIKQQMLAYALLLDGKVKAAAGPLQRLYDATGITINEGLPVLLAWTHIESGNFDAAAPLLKLNPVPPHTGVNTFMPLYFPRIFELRSMVAAKAGKTDEAKQDLDLFQKLSGK